MTDQGYRDERKKGYAWVCAYCGQPITPEQRKTAVRSLLTSYSVGRAHAACKARAIAEGKR